MKSVIEDILLGERGNIDVIKESDKYWQVHKEYCKVHDLLDNGLTDSQKELLLELYKVSGELEAETGCTYFKEGFKLGLLLAVEAFI